MFLRSYASDQNFRRFLLATRNGTSLANIGCETIEIEKGTNMTDKTINKVLLKQEQGEMDQIVVILLHLIAEQRAPQKRIMDLLKGLHLRVMAHLADDEPCGFLGEKTQGIPELAMECDALRQTHASLIEEFDRVLQLAAQSRPTYEWWNELERQFHGLCVMIGQYLSNEQMLLEKIDDEPL